MESQIQVAAAGAAHLMATDMQAALAALASLSSSTERPAAVYCLSPAPANGLAQQV
jgi:hypothetical protein